jgi:hypothetical protein
MPRLSSSAIKRPLTIAKLYPDIFNPLDLDAIHASFEANGFVVLRVLSHAECVAHIKRQVTDIWLRQPWVETLRVHDPITGRELDIERDTERYVEVLTSPGLLDATLAHYKRVGPLHGGFGACCDPGSFHSPELWALRQREDLYRVAVRLLQGEEALWVDINRSIQKLPTMGEDEFLHWDVPFLHLPWAPVDALGGKVGFTATEFVCVPGTNTEDAHADIVEHYARHYPHAKASDAKFALDPSVPDPLSLARRRVAVQVPAGCLVLWSKWTLHGVCANPREAAIQFGAYLGWFKAESRPEYARRAEGGISERQDRIESYLRGRAPALWPSLDPIWYYPKRYLNFGRLLAPYVAKTRPDWPGLTTRAIKTGARKGERVPHLVPVLDPDYAPPALTELGERLLGLRTYSNQIE